MRVFLNVGNDYLLKDYSQKNKKNTFNSASTTNQTNIWSEFYFQKNFDVLIVTVAT